MSDELTPEERKRADDLNAAFDKAMNGMPLETTLLSLMETVADILVQTRKQFPDEGQEFTQGWITNLLKRIANIEIRQTIDPDTDGGHRRLH
jgi:hypothetical protein